MKLSHKGLSLVCLILVVQSIFVFALLKLIDEAEVEAAREAHAKAIVGRTNDLINNCFDIGSGLKAYFVARDAKTEKEFQAILTKIRGEIKWLKSQMKRNPKGLASVKRVEDRAEKMIGKLEEAKAIVDSGSVMDSMPTLKQFRVELQPLFDGLVQDVNILIKTQQGIVEESPKAQAQARAASKQLLYGGIAANIAAAILLAIFFLRNISSRIEILVDNTSRLAADQPLNPRFRSSDEISHLDSVFHSMAGELKEARRKERAIFDNAQDIICAIDEGTRFTQVSPACQSLWQHGENELLGRRLADILLEEDREYASEMLEAAKSQNELPPFEARVAIAEADPVDTLWSVHWSKEEKTYFCVAHDITDRKRAEELIRSNEARIRAIIESMPVGLLVAELDGTIRFLNPMSQRMFLYNANELEGESIARLFPSGNEVEGLELVDDLLALTDGKIGERQAEKASGAIFPVEMSVEKFDSHDGTRLLVIMLDVTERHELEKMRQSFVSMVSHELRSPLTSVQNFLGMLNMGVYGELSDQMLKLGTSAERSVEHLIRLINELLDVEKMESGSLEMRFADTCTSDIIDATTDIVQGYADKYKVKLDMSTGDIELNADKDRLVQVLINLISNACKFSPPGETVSVTSELEDGAVFFRVTDRGPGVPEKYREMIFERFQQVSESDSTQKGGTGLGLAICKAIVEQHDGTIGVNCSDGEGSTFWFRIPVSRNS